MPNCVLYELNEVGFMWGRYPGVNIKDADVPLLDLEAQHEDLDSLVENEEEKRPQVSESKLSAIFKEDCAYKLYQFFIKSKPDINNIKDYLKTAILNNNALIIFAIHDYASTNLLIENRHQHIKIPVSSKVEKNPLELAIIWKKTASVQALCDLGYLTNKTYQLGIKDKAPHRIRELIRAYGAGRFDQVKSKKCCVIL